MSKLRECTTLRAHPNINFRHCMLVECQCSTSVVTNIPWGGGSMGILIMFEECVEIGSIEKSLYTFLSILL